jgi:hypothetical protein
MMMDFFLRRAFRRCIKKKRGYICLGTGGLNLEKTPPISIEIVAVSSDPRRVIA